jgi:hypothetical protein
MMRFFMLLFPPVRIDGKKTVCSQAATDTQGACFIGLLL